MQELRPKLNFISKQWRMTTVGISNGQSINNMLNTAYNNGARTHTNSWGSKSSSDWGVILHHQRMWMIEQGTTTNFTVVEKV